MAYEFKPNEEGTKLTVDFFKQNGFIREVIGDEAEIEDNDVSWYKDGLAFVEEQWKKDSFSFPLHFREDGTMKSGYNVVTEQQVKNIYYAFTSKEL